MMIVSGLCRKFLRRARSLGRHFREGMIMKSSAIAVVAVCELLAMGTVRGTPLSRHKMGFLEEEKHTLPLGY